MRATTIRASAATVGAVVSYLEGRVDRSSRDDADRAVGYYVDEDEPPGYWWGEGCEAVGLAGRVEPGELTNMLHARHPGSGEPLGRRFGDRSARAFDCTFSAAKSVSVLWALSDDVGVRAETVAAHDAAVEGALSWLERHGSHTRRGTDGAFQVDARGLTVGVFRQHTSRSDDPQLHTHAVVWSKVQDETGRWLALDARFLKRQQKTIGWIYDAALRSELTRRLGVSWERVAGGSGKSDIVGVPAEGLELFSTRSRLVEAKLNELLGRWSDEHDGADPDPKTIAALERSAAVTSRPAKSHATGLHAMWRARAVRAGVELDAIPTSGRRPGPVRVDFESVIDEAIHRVAEQTSVWVEADLAREIATLIPPSYAQDCDDLLDCIDDLAADAFGRCTELHPPVVGPARASDGRPASEHVTDRIATTQAVLDQERRLLDWAARSAGPPRAGVAALDPQRNAAHAIAGTERLVLVVGPAGAGKTTTVRHAVTDLHAQGRRVVGLTPSGKAADVLARETGCPALTLAKFLHNPAHAAPAGTTVVLDEAGMASTNDLDELVRRADQHRWRLVCVGDPEQLPAVGRGGMFAHWCDQYPVHELTEIHRFAESWQAVASKGLRRGDPAAVAAYVEHGRVAALHSALLARRVADQYLNRAANGQSVAITTTAADTAREINLAIQARTTPVGPEVALGDGTTMRAGDRIATRRNDPTITSDRGVTVRNRHTWSVERIELDGSVTVADPTHGTVRLPARYVAEHVELGWAVTGYGNQGVTTDHGICVIEPSSSRAGVYVGLTRGRNKNIALIADPTGTLDPADALAAAIVRPANNLTAHAQQANLYRSKGLEPPELSPLTREIEAAEAELDDADRMLQQLQDFAAERPGPSRALGR